MNNIQPEEFVSSLVYLCLFFYPAEDSSDSFTPNRKTGQIQWSLRRSEKPIKIRYKHANLLIVIIK